MKEERNFINVSRYAILNFKRRSFYEIELIAHA